MNHEAHEAVLVEETVIAAIAAAVIELGFSPSQIASIRPSISQNWKMAGRFKGR